MFGIRDVEMVREVVRQGGFRAAAHHLGVAQSAVSARIALLEKRLGIQIFDRQQRQVRLTATGRRFIEQAERLITLRDRIVAELRPEADYVGTIRIGVAETVVHTLLPAMLQHLRSAIPNIRFELSVDTSPVLAAKLTDDEIDVAVLMRRLVPEQAEQYPLATFAMAWFAAPRLDLPAQSLRTRDLAALPIVTFSKDTLPYREIQRLFADPDVPAPLLHASASLSTMVRLVRDGFGIGTLPVVMAQDDCSAGRLRELTTEPAAQLSPLDFVLCHLPSQNPVIMQQLIAAARFSEQHWLSDHKI